LEDVLDELFTVSGAVWVIQLREFLQGEITSRLAQRCVEVLGSAQLQGARLEEEAMGGAGLRNPAP
jgi:hypothetical protein